MTNEIIEDKDIVQVFLHPLTNILVIFLLPVLRLYNNNITYYFRLPSLKKNFLVRASVFNDNNIHSVINYLKNNQNNRIRQYEADYSRLMSMILPYYYPYPNFYISPEQHWGEAHHPDYTVGRPDNTGKNNPSLFVELKRAPIDGSIPGWAKMLNQMWDQCDAANSENNGNGRMWTIAQRGLVICFFKFDLSSFGTGTEYTNFQPLIPSGWTIDTFRQHNIKIRTEVINGVEEIRLIWWRFDNPSHLRYIHGMFNYISNTNA